MDPSGNERTDMEIFCSALSVFKAALKEAEFQRKEYIRKQGASLILSLMLLHSRRSDVILVCPFLFQVLISQSTCISPSLRIAPSCWPAR